MSTQTGRSGSGRKYKDLDGTLDGMWWILCTGSMWNQLPKKYGKWNSIWRCFNRWSRSGLWSQILEMIAEHNSHLNKVLMVDASHVKAHQDSTRSPLTPEEQKLGKTKGGRNTKISVSVNGLGFATGLVVVCGNQYDGKSLFEVLPDEFVNSYILADKAYDSDKIRKAIFEAGGIAVIPPKKNRVTKSNIMQPLENADEWSKTFSAELKGFDEWLPAMSKLPKIILGL